LGYLSVVPPLGQPLSFLLHDEMEGQPLTTRNIDLLTLHQFMGEVIELIQGEAKRAELGQPSVTIEDGSVKLISIVTPLVAASFLADMETLARSEDLDAISPKRAQIIEAWQSRATRADSKRRYGIVPNAERTDRGMVLVTRNSAYRHHQLDHWVRAEKYISGRVVDLGGKTKPNIHLVLPSGESIKVESSESQLEGADYLYKPITLNVSAMEHIHSGELRDLRLIDVVRPLKEIDEDKLKSLWQKGRKAWAEITNPTEWVEHLRES
jgi:hypothetical protein